jgi:hypothetical protein
LDLNSTGSADPDTDLNGKIIHKLSEEISRLKRYVYAFTETPEASFTDYKIGISNKLAIKTRYFVSQKII